MAPPPKSPGTARPSPNSWHSEVIPLATPPCAIHKPHLIASQSWRGSELQHGAGKEVRKPPMKRVIRRPGPESAAHCPLNLPASSIARNASTPPAGGATSDRHPRRDHHDRVDHARARPAHGAPGRQLRPALRRARRTTTHGRRPQERRHPRQPQRRPLRLRRRGGQGTQARGREPRRPHPPDITEHKTQHAAPGHQGPMFLGASGDYLLPARSTARSPRGDAASRKPRDSVGSSPPPRWA